MSYPGNSLKAIYWCNWAHLISLHSLVDHCLLLPDVQCLVNYFKYFVHFFVASGRGKEDQSGPLLHLGWKYMSLPFVLIIRFWNCEHLILLLNYYSSCFAFPNDFTVESLYIVLIFKQIKYFKNNI